ncbi:PREDICTED: uncharacterized protein C6orf106 homolog isoform X2 [Nicrophorus vespilloides]|uniref:Uncharacterized protein C6orf106 homolog isoform X2 n=1 Tax=Nicrophorus vespilloides TaxID=110193 RepID=A0ABM1M0Q5_NICVS|nr:PREDICTED: uncharacterized protein C6orf106 homolog isoform X2 [Nicrophorus vespilloides]
MDMDSTNGDNNGGIEQALLQQFSCMGTTDREELICNLQRVLGADLNYSTAAFYLDMNNWNLQAAICSYFDVVNSTKLPSMALRADPHASENDSVEPNTPFLKNWYVYNNGPERWPEGCYVQCSAGDTFGGEKTNVKAMMPGEMTLISVDMVSPGCAGQFQSKWRLCTPTGTYFGDPLWMILTVVEERTMQLTDQLSHLNDLGAPLTNNVPANPFRSNEQIGNSDQDSHMC